MGLIHVMLSKKSQTRKFCINPFIWEKSFPGGSGGEDSACNVGDLGLIPRFWADPLEKGMTTHSFCSCLENSMDRGGWWATVHGIANVCILLYDYLVKLILNIKKKFFLIF